ncbi:BRCA1-associated RING domain protein 1 [Tetrabaena socialis]|uniref:BRCA1-associated RING domain protein 1 n=1 Tax=Tetrabaena socialis TaxID=47790 RepID=A0A2J7ZWA8_9CHLO|nr:BRCA1-associated RING domain protein 1 [Tetrabaena socialis]|eukprot:PNH04538.1 BRCA1-associated RING domain protein 1 [Tetrabaena socialis]
MQNGQSHEEEDDAGGETMEMTADEYTWLQEQMAAAGLGLTEVGGPGQWEDPTGGPLTELLAACENGVPERVEELLRDFPGDVNTPGPDGDTALHLACLYGNAECVRALLSGGADANIVNSEDGSTALHDAAAGGYLDICEMVLAKAEAAIVHVADADGDTPLHNAARGNHGGVVKLLLEKGASASVQNGEGNKPADEADDLPAEVLELLR